jgi:hypothetical protein
LAGTIGSWLEQNVCSLEEFSRRIRSVPISQQVSEPKVDKTDIPTPAISRLQEHHSLQVHLKKVFASESASAPGLAPALLLSKCEKEKHHAGQGLLQDARQEKRFVKSFFSVK